MIVLDANLVLQAITQPATTPDARMQRETVAFFRGANTGVEQFTTSEAIVAEVVFVLQRHYALAPLDVIARRRPLLALSGCRMPERARCLAALDLWETHPNLSLVDCRIAEQARELNLPLATYDAALARAAGVPRWSYESLADGLPAPDC